MAGILGVAVIGIAALTLRSMLQLPVTPGGSRPAPKCSPKPCTELDGWELYVTNVQRPPGRVTVDVSFRNNTAGGGFEAVSYRHSGVRDFDLLLSGGTRVRPTTGDGCPGWEEARIERGAAAGPDRLCFDVAGAAITGAQLEWSPDTGLLSATGTVPLP